MTSWIAGFQSVEPGLTVQYNPVGSGAGREGFLNGQYMFAGSDSALDAEEWETSKAICGTDGAFQVPAYISPVAVAYNLPSVTESVKMDAATIARIFKGEITKWNDAEIAAENENVDLPDTDISVVYRSDESGTTDNFQKFLGAATDIWDTEGQVFPTAVGEGANGSNGVASQVTAIDGGITYVEAGFATQQGLGVANLDFGNGPVELNTESVGVALDNLQFTSEGHDMVVDTEALFASDAEGSYPLILTTYEIVCSAGYDESTSAMVKDFLTVALDNQDEGLAELGYIPVTGTHAERLAEAVDAIQ